MLTMLAVSLSFHNLDAATLKRRGFEVLEQIRREYYLPKSKLYCDSIGVATPDGHGLSANDSATADRKPPATNLKKSGPAFNWGVGVMLSALNAAARLDSKYKPWLREFADASRVYWNDKGPVPGYDVLPCPKPVDRYYDDNAWMALALAETFEVLGDKKYLDWAEQALGYVLSGEDAKLGGGIYWRESDKKSKNACSNAPSAAACLAVARFRRADELISKSESLLNWTRENLQDRSDGLLWDNIALTGQIDKTKWTYNTGLFLRASAMLDEVGVVDNSNLVRMAKNSASHWIDPGTGAVKDSGRFAHLWLEGLAALDAQDPSYAAARSRALDYLWIHGRDLQGRFGDMWDRPFDPKRRKFELIDQASVARGLLFAAKRSSPLKGEVGRG